MKIKIGEIEFQLALLNPGKSVEELTLSDLQGAMVSVFAPNIGQASKPAASPPLQPQPTPALADALEDEVEEFEEAGGVSEIPEGSETGKYLALLKQAGMTNHTVVMTAKRLFGLKTSIKTLHEHFETIKQATFDWPNRDLSNENIWAIYIGEVFAQRLGRQWYAVGINDINQQIILGFSNVSETDLYRNLRKRKLKVKSIKFGMLPFESNREIFQTAFPEAVLARDWNEFMNKQETQKRKDEVKRLMVLTNRKDVERGLKSLDGPRELMSYLQFKPEHWRVLRTANNIKKITLSLKTNTKQKSFSAEDVKFVALWTLLRIQYQWERIPVDGKQFERLMHTQHLIASK